MDAPEPERRTGRGRGPAHSILLAVVLLAGVLAGAAGAAGCAAGRTSAREAEGPSGGRPGSAAAAARTSPPPKAAVPEASPPPPRVDFEADVRPILEGQCAPCHFEGGRMYEQLPFDSPGTVRGLGERLFTRIRDEADRVMIRAFLAQPEDGAQ